eukprot:208533-Prymnesium_polylepis.1
MIILGSHLTISGGAWPYWEGKSERREALGGSEGREASLAAVEEIEVHEARGAHERVRADLAVTWQRSVGVT